MKTAFALAVAALVCAGSVASAQTALKPLPVKSIHKLGFDPASGTAVKAPSSLQKSAPVLVYDNTAGSGWFSVPGLGFQWEDWGVLTGTAGHTTITNLRLGYASGNTSGGTETMRIRTYDGVTGFCTGIGTQEMDLTLTGLPGATAVGVNTGWLVNVDLKAAGLCFEQAEGPMGFSYEFTSTGTVGPLLAGGPALGIQFGDLDAFDEWDTTGTTCTGTFFFGGAPANPFASFYMGCLGWESSTSAGFSCLASNGLMPTLSCSGVACAGGVNGISLTLSNAPAGAPWALAIGNATGLGIGGTFGTGCTLDVSSPIGPILIPLPGAAPPINVKFTGLIPAAAPAGALCLQFIFKDAPPFGFITTDVKCIQVP